uniref:alpha-2Db adrenergic receptor-like n=1 Tax=Myxine glutinosa TaxID=7769 RepID=UPI00358FBEF3
MEAVDKDNSTAHNGTALAMPHSVATVAGLALLVGFIIFATIFGNVLVVIAVSTSKSLQAVQNQFLVSLAAADLLVATLVMPFSLANELMGYWYFGHLCCQLYLCVDVLVCTSSIAHLCAISLDRYWSVTKPVRYNLKRTPRHVRCVIVSVWIISAIISFPPLLLMDPQKSSEALFPKCELNSNSWYVLSSSIGSFFVPCLVMMLVYARIYQVAKGRARRSSVRSGVRARKPQKSDRGPSRQGVRNVLQDPMESGEMSPISSNGRKQVVLTEGENSDGLAMKLVDGTNSSHYQKPIGTVVEISNGNCVEPESQNTPKVSAMTGSGFHAVRTWSVNEDCDAKDCGFLRSEDEEPGALRPNPSAGAKLLRRKLTAAREKRFTFVLAVVMGVFVLCWFPFFFTYCLSAIGCHAPDMLFNVFFWFGYCNSSLNPLIYTVFNQDFRKAFKRILCQIVPRSSYK